MASDLKVFISWSKQYAGLIAQELYDWLPTVVERVEMWMSRADIRPGDRGLAEIEQELNDTSFGILVVTQENQHAPWLNFEAGALSKTVDGVARARVIPVLVDIGGPSQLDDPLGQFNCVLLDRDGTQQLVRLIGDTVGAKDSVIMARFAALWPTLEARLKTIEPPRNPPVTSKRSEYEMLQEILTIVRSGRNAADTSLFPGYAMHPLGESQVYTDADITLRFVETAQRYEIPYERIELDRRSNGIVFVLVYLSDGRFDTKSVDAEAFTEAVHAYSRAFRVQFEPPRRSKNPHYGGDQTGGTQAT